MPPYEHQTKKRRLDADDGKAADDGFKSGTRFRPTIAREWTVSVAVPTSVITDCVTREQRTTYAGRIARALAVFSVDEVVVYDDTLVDQRPARVDHEAYTGDVDPAHFLEHILAYLETPPFMRKTLFPLHPNLRSQGLLPSLDMPHHPHKDEWLPYREGMTLGKRPQDGKGTIVDIGMSNPVTISETIEPRTRLTLKMVDDGTPEPVHPTAPRTEVGYFWGYTVRKATSLSDVFTQSPYEDGYDLSIGTSERGLPLSRAFPEHKEFNFNHMIIVFGGPRGLEFAAMNDGELGELGIVGPRTKELFDHWVNVLPNQGSRGIRTDEAMLIALTGLRRLWDTS
ncbi:putative RNA methyltransferase [Lasiosphaeria miniovina]|uniref:RNA methyltransferase n=1 Tax=Lasiosphaeria miniovina TaxID=1954250 RepID=A0AA40EDS3_9PEZI|nr:putative RNA methyltransferase [Lasiosphaeria miniovina]KAK0733746.1 putative RNA methyltransferase [Lasiosphaeria miniovina]